MKKVTSLICILAVFSFIALYDKPWKSFDDATSSVQIQTPVQAHIQKSVPIQKNIVSSPSDSEPSTEKPPWISLEMSRLSGVTPSAHIRTPTQTPIARAQTPARQDRAQTVQTQVPIQKSISTQMDMSASPSNFESLVERVSPISLETLSLEKANEFYIPGTKTVELKIPSNPNQNILLSEPDSGQKIGIGIDAKGNGELNGNMVVYSSDKYSVGVEAFEGGVRQTFIINASDAKAEYEIPYTIPEGGYLKYAVDDFGNSDGSILVATKNGESSIAAIDRPWAKDANGNDVPTHYEIRDRNVLVQVVLHSDEYAYPVVADPTTYSTYFSSGSWITRNSVISLSLKPTLLLRASVGAVFAIAVVIDSWNKASARHSSNANWRNSHGMYEQYVCHFYFAFYKSEFNLEPSRPAVGLTRTIAASCNP